VQERINSSQVIQAAVFDLLTVQSDRNPKVTLHSDCCGHRPRAHNGTRKPPDSVVSNVAMPPQNVYVQQNGNIHLIDNDQVRHDHISNATCLAHAAMLC
jgi:hypothetical protein